MAGYSPAGWDRREFLGVATLVAMAAGLPLAAIGLSPEEAPTPRLRAVMRRVAQIVIPRGDTPGGGDVGAGDFALLGAAHGLENARAPIPADAEPRLFAFRRKDGSLDQSRWLAAELDRRGGGDFVTLGQAPQESALAAIDAEAYAEGVRDHPWRTVKALLLTGYYTSRAGGSQELRYELVPGRWVPDMALSPLDRAWSSDWTGVEFG